MASLVLGVIGGVIGAFVGGPVGAQVGFALGSAIGGYIDTVNTKINTSGPRLQDRAVQISSNGVSIPILYGASRFAGNVIWSSDIIETVSTSHTGGKGGTPQVNNTSYTYSASFAVLLCEGPITGIRKIWADKTLIYSNGPEANAQTIIASTGLANGITVYLGDETQGADPLIESYVGVGNCPAYRGSAYIVFDNFQLANYGNRIPNLEFEVVAAGPTTVNKQVYAEDNSVTGAQENNDTAWVGKDASYLVYNFYTSAPNTMRRLQPDGSNTLVASGFLGANENIVPVQSNQRPMFAQMSIVAPLDEGSVTYQRIDIFDVLHPYSTDDGGGAGAILHIGYDGTNATLLRSNLLVSYDEDTKIAAFSMLAIGGIGTAYATGVFLTGTRTAASGDPSVPAALRVSHYELAGTVPVPAGRAIISFQLYQGFVWMLNRAGNTIYLTRFDQTTLTQTDDWIGPTYSWASAGYQWTKLRVNEFGAFAWVDHDAGKSVIRFSASGATVLCNDADGPGSSTMNRLGNYVYQFWTDGNFAVIGPTASTSSSLIPARLYAIAFNSLASSDVTLASVVTNLGNTRGGIPQNVTSLTDTVHGYLITKQMQLRQAIEFMATLYRFDAVEDDGTLIYVKRGGAPIRTLTLADLGAHEAGTTPVDPLMVQRTQEIDLPQSVVLNYTDKDNAYQQGSLKVQRLNTSSRQTATLDSTALSTTADEAAKFADVAMMESWVGRTTFQFQTNYQQADLKPTDVVQIDTGPVLHRMRITKRTDFNGLLKFEAIQDDGLIITSQAVGEGVVLTSQIGGINALTDLELLDIAILRDADNDPGYYAVASPYGSPWAGAVISEYSGGTYSPVATVSRISPIGIATTTLGDYTGVLNTFDEGNIVTVQFFYGTLSSVTAQQALAGQNAFLIGTEIVIARTVTLISGSLYQLSGLLRYQRGTEGATHTASERVVSLGTAGTVRIYHSASDIGMLRSYAATSIGRTQDTSSVKSITNTAAGLKPFAPIQLGSGTDNLGQIVMTWRRETRLSAPLRDYVDAPLGETTESYVVDVASNSGFTTPIRSISVSAPTATYTLAQQGADLSTGLVTRPFQWRVRQVSSVVGAGAESVTATVLTPTQNIVGEVFHLNTFGVNGSTNFGDLSPYAAAVTHSGSSSLVNIQSNKAFFPTALLDYLIVSSDMALNVGSHDFVWTLPFNTTSTRQYATLMARQALSAGSGGSFSMQINSPTAGDGRLTYYNGDFNAFASAMLQSPSGTAYNDGKDHTVVIRRVGSTWTMEIDGVTVSTATFAGAMTNLTSRIISFGEDEGFTGRRYTGIMGQITLSIS